jgi:Fe-S cluster assembly iron-binding protein IscA
MILTPNAASLLRVIKESEGLSTNAGLRISTSATRNGHGPELEFAFTEAPLPGDLVDSRDGEEVFVAPELAGDLAEATLDVDGDDEEGYAFVIRSD